MVHWIYMYCIEESQEIINSKKYCIFISIDFVLANSADPDEMPHFPS